MSFLAAHEPRPLAGDFPTGLEPIALHLGQGSQALEIAVFKASSAPTQTALKATLLERKGRRASPVLVVVIHGSDRAAICGLDEQDPTAYTDLDRRQVERLCLKALGASGRHVATRVLRDAFPQLTSTLPGLSNHGLFALHELEAGVPRRPDWRQATRDSVALLEKRGRELVQGLGFAIRDLLGADPGSVLVANTTKVAIAVFLERPDEIDPPLRRFNDRAPISWALAKADEENLDYVVISAGSVLRVYPTKPGVGAGRRGRTETYVSLDLDLLRPADAAYLRVLCSADALAKGGSFEDILAKSLDYAADLGVKLRERVYREVVPQLARALVVAQKLRSPSNEKLRATYEVVLRVLFRLLFVAYAEDNDRLPLHSNSNYRKHSLKEMAKRLQQELTNDVEPSREDFYWTEVQQLWKAVDKGNRGWGVPEYNGGLFASTENDLLGHRLADLTMPDSDFVPALRALLLDETEEGQVGPIDFRSLGVREFGTIYEGLLESELSVADVDLVVERGREQRYLPAGAGAEAAVKAGEVYLHNASGARKASGAYYTKKFAVEYLLDRALDPALDNHFGRLDSLTDRDAADKLFEFRVADIAMGSGHFLVAALDHIERRFQNYLVKRTLPGVADELGRLRQAAREQLGEEFDPDAVEDVRLLRRQIARRCIFGVDRNPLAVELARLSIWIHSFVPGLPLSFLDGNLIVGNSLAGIATFAEASELIAADEGELFGSGALERLRRAREPLERLARLSEATAKEVRQASDLYVQARASIQDEERFLTVLTASRLNSEIQRQVGLVAVGSASGEVEVPEALFKKAQRELKDLDVTHFPIAFPQVFMGDRGGFDVILGNPPWEEATVEKDAFWARHFPGLRGLGQREQEGEKERLARENPDLKAQLEKAVEAADRQRRVLTTGPYPGMGTGDPDLYKAFVWRFWHLVAPEGGRIGVVLPRSALTAKGSTEFRTELFRRAKSIELVMLLNNKQWVFPEVHPQYTIGLTIIERGTRPDPTVPIELRGPYPSEERFRHGIARDASRITGGAIESWNDTASFPLLPSDESVEVFLKLRRAPRLDLDDIRSFRVRPNRELDATNDKNLMDVKSKTCPDDFWPVFKGESFDLWMPDVGPGSYYAWADPLRVLPVLQEKRLRSGSREDSVFSGFPEDWLRDERTLPCLQPRIAFRDVSRSTDTRTVRVALVPGEVFLANTGPYLTWQRGDERDQAYVLGVLSSLPLDWYARRYVETHLNYFVFNPLPLPRPGRDSSLWRRVVQLSGRLAAPDRRFGAWANRVGVPHGGLVADEKQDMIIELDAAVAHLYELNEADLRHIFETFHEGWAFGPQLEATLRHFRSLARLT
jgi:hypothetical protein